MLKHLSALALSLSWSQADASATFFPPDWFQSLPQAMLRAAVQSVSASQYSFGTQAKDGAQAILVDRENQNVSRALQMAKSKLGDQWEKFASESYSVVIVPGFTPRGVREPVKLHKTAKSRLELAVKAMKEVNALAIIVSGGNVRPDSTPYNEALEMKRSLIADFGLSDYQVAIDPYALDTTTNLRNAGRFMLSHAIPKGLIVTSVDQNYYLGYPHRSTFTMRCKTKLGYLTGKLKAIGLNRTSFFPSRDVFQKGKNDKDP